MLVSDNMGMNQFTIDQLMEYDKHYKETCNAFFNLTNDKDMLAKLKAILYDGFVGNYNLSSGICTNQTIGKEIERRISMAYLLINNPDTFNFFVENNINMFHGTNFSVLPSILKYGLRSLSSLKENDIPILSGEKRSCGAINFKMLNRPVYGVYIIKYISFTDSINVAEEYSSLIKKGDDKNSSFDVIICTSSDELNGLETSWIPSDYPEIGVLESFPTERIKCICVPSDRVELVKKMLPDDKIAVLGVDHLDKKFFGVDSEVGDYVDFYLDKYMEYRKFMRNSGKRFSSDEVKELAESRLLSKMREFLSQLKQLHNKDGGEGGKEDGKHIK